MVDIVGIGTKRHSDKLRISTIRDFSGGLNVIDNDLSLSTAYSKIEENMYRDYDGAKAVRYGTTMFTDVSAYTDMIGDMNDNPFTTTAASKIVTVSHTNHALLSGHTITYVDVVGFDDIPAGDFNTSHIITRVDENSYTITVNTSATTGATGGGTDVTYSYDNQNLSGDIINIPYYDNKLITCDDTGEIAAIDGNANSVVIWDDDITNMLSGSFPIVGNYIEDPYVVTNGSATITVTHETHGLNSTETITIRDSEDVGGILALEIDGDRVITKIDNDSYTIVADGNATSNTTGGGKNAYYSHTNFAPEGWHNTTFISTSVFNGELIVCNGIDKPLLINFTNPQPCSYLVDIPVSSNYFTPICKYVTVCSGYVIMAGDPEHVDRLHISHKNASGTWYGDSAPNDATQIDLGKSISSTNQEIRGIKAFRNKVIVAFDEAVLIVALGTYDDSNNHIPVVEDTIEYHGSISHRSMISLGEDFLMCDFVGVPSLARALFTQALKTERVSELVDPEIQSAIDGLSTLTTEERIWAVYNQRDGQYMLFIPNDDILNDTTETLCFVFTYNPKLKIAAWSKYKGWNFTCGCITALKNLFMAGKTKIYYYGNRQAPVHKDFIGDNAKAIDFVWELPWADFKDRGLVKLARYLSLETLGDAEFSLDMFVDNKYSNRVTGVLTPDLSMIFKGGNIPGFGGESPNYGGGRRTSDERLFAWTSKFKIMKLRFSGSIDKALKVVSISFYFLKGSIRR